MFKLTEVRVSEPMPPRGGAGYMDLRPVAEGDDLADVIVAALRYLTRAQAQRVAEESEEVFIRLVTDEARARTRGPGDDDDGDDDDPDATDVLNRIDLWIDEERQRLVEAKPLAAAAFGVPESELTAAPGVRVVVVDEDGEAD